MPFRPSRPVVATTAAGKPPVDEWGIYDPTQAGLEALYQRLQAQYGAASNSDAKNIAAAMEAAANKLKK